MHYNGKAPMLGTKIADGKAKSMHKTDDNMELVMFFKDDTSAFDGAKIIKLTNKGRVNNAINSHIMGYLQDNGVDTHFIKQISAESALVRKLRMLPVEFVVRNRAAGSLCKRLGIERGTTLDPPLFELFYKDDDLGDPMITESHAVTFGWAKPEDLERGQVLSMQINDLLSVLFEQSGMILVDYKLEFGIHGDRLILGDEFTPDGCRLWDSETLESLDKDRFREGKGNVIASYMTVADRLGIKIP
jgi:phosphoribosylaminoimidazole-succinocarboxamide synthase